MNIQKELKIGGFVFPVIESQEVANEGNAFGSMHFKHQKIFLEPSETIQMKEQTIFHEILHAIWWQSGLSSRYRKNQPNLEEEVIDALSNGLYQVLKVQ